MAWRVDGCILLGTHLDVGVPLSYVFLVLQKNMEKLHTFSCRPTYRPILHINLYKQMRFRISMVVCNVRSEIKTARAKAFSWASAKGHHVVAQTSKEQTTAIEMRKIGGRKEAIHQTFFPRAIAAVCKCKCQLNT